MKSPPVPLNSLLSAAATRADNKTGSAFQIAGQQLADSQNINSDDDNNTHTKTSEWMFISPRGGAEEETGLYVCASRRVCSLERVQCSSGTNSCWSAWGRWEAGTGSRAAHPGSRIRPDCFISHIHGSLMCCTNFDFFFSGRGDKTYIVFFFFFFALSNGGMQILNLQI